MPSPLLAFWRTGRAWGALAVVVLAVVAAGWLGMWQFGAWQAHREAARQDLTHQAPVPLAQALGPDEPLTGDHLGQPVTIEGTWLRDSAAIWRPGGLWRVSFLKTDTGSAIPVVLGWRAQAHLHDPFDPPTTITGWLQPSQDDAPERGGDALSSLRIADLAQLVHSDLYSAYVVADHSASPGVDWQDLRQAHLEQEPSAGSWAGLRNLFYGVEWWFFAGFAIFLWGKWIRDETREQEATEDAVPLSA